MTKKTTYSAVIILSTALFLVGLVYILGQFDSVVEVQESLYQRDIYIVVDQTESLEEPHRPAVIKAVNRDVLPRLALGDRVFCYKIVSQFDESKARVFELQGLPKIPENLAEMSEEQSAKELSTRRRQFEAARGSWYGAIEALAVEESKESHSDYLGVLHSVGKRLHQARSEAKEQLVVVLGDLKHTSHVKLKETTPEEAEEEWFENADVYLVCPYCSSKGEEQKEIEQYWQKFFAERGNDEIIISSFDGFFEKFPTSPVSDLGEVESEQK